MSKSKANTLLQHLVAELTKLWTGQPSEIKTACGQEPLFGHKSGKQSKTHWMCFMKEDK